MLAVLTIPLLLLVLLHGCCCCCCCCAAAAATAAAGVVVVVVVVAAAAAAVVVVVGGGCCCSRPTKIYGLSADLILIFLACVRNSCGNSVMLIGMHICVPALFYVS